MEGVDFRLDEFTLQDVDVRKFRCLKVTGWEACMTQFVEARIGVIK